MFLVEFQLMKFGSFNSTHTHYEGSIGIVTVKLYATIS